MESIRIKNIQIKTANIIMLFLMMIFFILLCPMGVNADINDFSVDNVTVMQDSVNWDQSLRVKLDYTCVPSEPDYIEIDFYNQNAVYSIVNDPYGGQTHLGSRSIGVRVDLRNRNIYEFDGKLIEQTYSITTGKGSLLFDIYVGQGNRPGYYNLYSIQTVHQYKEDGQYKFDAYIGSEEIGLECAEIGFNVHTYYGYEAFVMDYLQEDLDEALSQLKDGDVAAVVCREDILTGTKAADNGRALTYRDYGWYQAEKRFFDAIKGKDVTLLLCAPSQAGCCAEVNGMDIVNETRDVIIDTSMGYVMGLDSGDVELILRFPDNGKLPGKIKFLIGAKKAIANDIRYSGGKIEKSGDDVIRAMKVYHVVSGKLIQENSELIIDGLGKVWIELDHNSNFVASGSNSEKLRSFKLSAGKTSFTYNGKVQKPVVSVEPIKGTSYTIKYSSPKSKEIGQYTVTVKGRRDGFGSVKVKYTICPKGTSIRRLSRSGKSMTIKWKKQSNQTDGYQIQYSTKKSFKSGNRTVTVKGARKTSARISKLKSGKKYYVRLRTFKNVSGKRIYSRWSKSLSA